MKAYIIDAVALRAISPTALRGYATFEGWKNFERYGDTSEVYLRQRGDRSSEIILPVSDKIGDYPSVVAQLISIFAREGNKDELAIYRDLVHADRDVIRARSPHADDDGSIAVNDGVNLITEARNMLAAAACSARTPQSYYHMGKIQLVTEYMQRVRLGQTEAGSYVVTLLAPVPPSFDSSQNSLWPDLHLDPYDRQVTRFLASGLEAASNALAEMNRGKGISAFEAAIGDGVSANLCDAVAVIAEQSDGAEVSVTWARTRPAPIETSHISFSRKDAEPLREVARQFRLREPRYEVTLLGTPTKLQRARKQTVGRITFAAIIDDRPQSVTLELAPDDYDRAVEAHKKRQPIVVVGDLMREGQRWRLRNARDVAIIVPPVSD
jgi:hypothetical protein